MSRDFSRSRAILISNAVFTDEKIADLGAAAGCAPAMKELLTSKLCGWPPSRVEILADTAAPGDLATRLLRLTDGVEDVLLLYYVGHGLRMPNGQLTLALKDTSPNRALLRHTAMAYKDIADILRGSPAATKLVILDCCYAELGSKDNDQFQSADIDAEPVDGLYCIWASKEWEQAKSPPSGRLTYFTDALIDVVRTGIAGKPAQLTIEQVFIELRAKLLRAGRPEPASSGNRDARRWPFARNAAPPQLHRDLERENAILLGRATTAEERVRDLVTEIASLKARAASAGTTGELRQYRGVIDTAERLLRGVTAAGDSANDFHLQPEARERFVRAEIASLKARASSAATTGQLRQFRSVIDTAERLYADTVADGADAGDARDRQARTGFLDGRYELEALIAAGGMAEVYRAWDLRLDRVVAVKMLRQDLVDNPTSQARFRREAQAAASLNHPSIVALYDSGEDMSSGTAVPYIVMSYVDGRTVRDLLIDGHQLLPERALEIVSGVLGALEYSHRAGIVHRDIKPGNVMVTRDGGVKVMDFGIARAMTGGQATMTGTAQVIGTVQYLSPEQARGERVDARSDLYSTGCLLYELLTGQPPFTGDSPLTIARQHVEEDPVAPTQLIPGLPRWADAIVLKAMAKAPGDRYQSATEMQADVQRAAAGMHEVAMSAGVPTRADHYDSYRLDRTQSTGRASTPTRRQAESPAADGAGRPRRKRQARRRLLLLILAVVVITGGALIAFSLANKSTDVPSLDGLALPQAEATITQAGLRYTMVRENSATVPVDHVISTSPADGQSVASGSSITVYYSTGIAKVTLKNYTGEESGTVQSVLKADGLLVNMVHSYSPEPLGQVIGQSPVSGTKVSTGATVTLTVSAGEMNMPTAGASNTPTPGASITPTPGNSKTAATGEVTVPEVQELNYQTARTELEQDGLVVILQSQYSGLEAGDGVGPGEVWHQNIAPHTVVPAGTTITLTYQGPAATATPTASATSSPTERTDPTETPTPTPTSGGGP